MADDARKLPVKSEGEPAPPRAASPFDLLRADIDRVFENFGACGRLVRPRLAWPDWGSNIEMFAAPAIDVVEKDRAFEITAELPGVDEQEITLTVSNGVLKITVPKTAAAQQPQQTIPIKAS